MKFTSLIICISLIIGLSYVSAEQANQADDLKNGILDTNNEEMRNKLNLLLSNLESDEANSDDQEDEDEGLHRNTKRMTYRYGKRMNYRYGKRAAMPYRFGKRNPESSGLNAQEVIEFLKLNQNNDNKRLSYRYGK